MNYKQKLFPGILFIAIAMIFSACMSSETVSPAEAPNEATISAVVDEIETALPTAENTIVVPKIEPTVESTLAEPTIEPTATEQPVIKSINQAQIDALNGLTISLRHPFYQNLEKFEALIEEFNQTNPWGFNVITIEGGGLPGVAASLGEESFADNLVIASAVDISEAQPKRDFIALDDFALDPVYGLQEVFDVDSPFVDFQPSFGEELHYEIPLAYNTGILLFNTSWAQELGFPELPKTQDELLAVAQAARLANLADSSIANDNYGGIWLSRSALSAQNWYQAFGGRFDFEGEAFTPQAEPMLNSFNFLKNTFLLSNSWGSIEKYPFRYFSDRMAVIAESDLTGLPEQAAYQQTGNFQDDFTALSYPAIDGKGSLVLEALSLAIPKANEDTELAAWLFASWLMEPEQQAKLVEIHGLWPSIGNPEKIAPQYAAEHPTWASALANQPELSLEPEVADWTWIRLLFQDAYERVYNLDASAFPRIIEVFEQSSRINREQRP